MNPWLRCYYQRILVKHFGLLLYTFTCILTCLYRPTIKMKYDMFVTMEYIVLGLPMNTENLNQTAKYKPYSHRHQYLVDTELKSIRFFWTIIQIPQSSFPHCKISILPHLWIRCTSNYTMFSKIIKAQCLEKHKHTYMIQTYL